MLTQTLELSSGPCNLLVTLPPDIEPTVCNEQLGSPSPDNPGMLDKNVNWYTKRAPAIYEDRNSAKVPNDFVKKTVPYFQIPAILQGNEHQCKDALH